MSTIRIRPGIRADIPVLLEIYNYEVLHGTATLDIHPRTMEQWEEWFDGHGKENHPLLVAEIADADTGPDAAQQDTGRTAGSAAQQGTGRTAGHATQQCTGRTAGNAAQQGAGRIAGYATLSSYRTKEAYASTVELSVYIAPDFRRRGVASLLMEEILKLAREDERTHLVVSVITSGNEASAALHNKFGFTFAGNIPEAGVKFGEYQGIDQYYLIV